MSNEVQSSNGPLELVRSAPLAEVDEKTPDVALRDRGRRLILLGWVITMMGVALYCRAMFRAGPDTDLVEALSQNGIAGWGSVAFLALGIAVWGFGNVALLRDATR